MRKIPGAWYTYTSKYTHADYSYMGLYTQLLLLNSSCGATRYTRRNRHNQDHDTESQGSLHDVYQ